MFEEVGKKQHTAQDLKALALEVVLALALCGAIAIGLVWVFRYTG
jgi:hypothetical protein